MKRGQTGLVIVLGLLLIAAVVIGAGPVGSRPVFSMPTVGVRGFDDPATIHVWAYRDWNMNGEFDGEPEAVVGGATWTLYAPNGDSGWTAVRWCSDPYGFGCDMTDIVLGEYKLRQTTDPGSLLPTQREMLVEVTNIFPPNFDYGFPQYQPTPTPTGTAGDSGPTNTPTATRTPPPVVDPSKAQLTVLAYEDTNGNGYYDGGVDRVLQGAGWRLSATLDMTPPTLGQCDDASDSGGPCTMQDIPPGQYYVFEYDWPAGYIALMPLVRVDLLPGQNGPYAFQHARAGTPTPTFTPSVTPTRTPTATAAPFIRPPTRTPTPIGTRTPIPWPTRPWTRTPFPQPTKVATWTSQ